MASLKSTVKLGVPCQPSYTDHWASVGYENVRLISKEGYMVAMNACIFASSSQLCYDLLRSVGPFAADEEYYVSVEHFGFEAFSANVAYLSLLGL